nr:polyprotein [Civet picornavirus]
MAFLFRTYKNEPAGLTVRKRKVTMSVGPVQYTFDVFYLQVWKHHVMFYYNNYIKFGPIIQKVKLDDFVSVLADMGADLKCTKNDGNEIDISCLQFERLGQVNSHQTGTTDSRLHANAGGNITYINYYGSNSANAWNPTQQAMDPEKFTKPLADVAGAAMGPALKSPSVEECGYSDRIIQITSGNSCITTQEAAQAVVAYGKWPEYYTDAVEAIDEPTKPGVSCDRFYTLDSFQWTKTTVAYVIHLPGALTNLGVFGQNCQYHYLYRSGFCVHVQCNASKFHQGMLVCAMIPEFQMPTFPTSSIQELTSWDQWPKEWPIGQVTLAPHQLINLRTNNSATIIFPFCSPVPANFALSHDHVSLVIFPLVPLDYSQGASTVIPVTVSIAPMCSQYSGLRQSLATTQGIPTFNIPGSGQFSTVLRNAGYPAYPELEETHSFENAGRVTNLLEVAQIGTFVDFQQTGTGFAYTIDVSNNIKAAPVFSWDLSFLSSHFLTTYLARLAKLYNNYRGSINLEFMFCGSAMATGKLLLAYVPPGGNTPTSRTEAMLSTHTIWDIGLQSTCSFTIPFISTSQYRYNMIDNNVLSLDGFVVCFYQTAIVVPPGAPSTCQLVCKLSAAKNFCFRIPTDDAYYQGIGDDIQKVTQDSINHALQSVTLPAVTDGVPPGLSLTAGDSAALTASETGASASKDGSTTMEVRATSTVFSAAETDIEYLFSRYFYLTDKILQLNSNENVYQVIGPIGTFLNSNPLKTKFKMFTYWKYDLDIIVIPTLQDLQAVDLPHLRFQIMFVPYGSSLPSGPNSPLWNTTANPVVTFSMADPPASIRIPFLTVASAFAAQYNGYGAFGPHNAQNYGFFPGNYFGTLFYRILTTEVGNNNRYRLTTMVRPVNIKAYMPRPLVPYGTSRSVGNSRVRFVDADDVYERLGARQLSPFNPEDQEVSDELRWLYHICYPVNTVGPFTMFRLKGDKFILPAHAVPPYLKKLTVYDFASGWYDWENFHQELTIGSREYCKELDLVIIQLCGLGGGRGLIDYLPEYSDELLLYPDVFVCSPYFKNYYGNCDSSAKIVSSYEIVDKARQYNAYSFKLERIDYGYCGGVIFQDRKVCGMIVAGLPSHSVGIATALSKSMFDSSGSFSGFNYTGNPVISVFALGLTDWVESTGRTMGAAFSTEVVNNVTPLIQRIEESAASTLDVSLTKSILKIIIKIVSAFSMILVSSDRMLTIMSLTAFVGVDLLSNDPFVFLRDSILSMFGHNAEEQGVSDWIKEFNAACNAAKGLDWVVEKFSKFFDWLKKFFEKENPLRTRFLQLMDVWPETMEKFEQMETKQVKMSDADRRALCERVIRTKNLCDKFGIQRNFATTQVVKYAARAGKILAGMESHRYEPVAICIHGQPGTGKSLATEIIGRALSKHCDGQKPYSLPPDPNFFDGYLQQDVVIMDDVGQNPDGNDLKLFCQMVSCTAFIPPQADLPDKGTPFTSKFVLTSTNLETLKPPTISEPRALHRRMFLDCDIKLKDSYRLCGKLDVERATRKCSTCDKPENFSFCTPLVCGAALTLVDRATRVEYSLDKVITMLLAEKCRREKCLDYVDGLFQGTDEEWLMSDWDRVQEEEVQQVSQMPQVLVDLLRSTRSEEVLRWCIENGYVVPASCVAVVERKKVNILTKHWKSILSGLSFLLGISVLILTLIRLMCHSQGAYSGIAQTPATKPKVRQVEVQGPDVEFVTKLFKTNVFPVVTEKGPFTGLGIRDNLLVLPTHSRPGDSLLLDGVKVNIKDKYELCLKGGPTEITVCELERVEKFRDITKFLPDHAAMEHSCWLVMNSDSFPRMILPVGTASLYGSLCLSGRSVKSTLMYPYPTRTGQCGGVVAKAGKILGIHIGGDGYNGYAAFLKKSYFSHEQGEIVSVRKNPTPIHLSSKTSLQPSVFHDVFPGEKEPAVLHPKDPRCEVEFEKALFSKYKGNSSSIPPYLDVAVSHYVEQIRPLVPLNVAEPLSLEEVVYGTDNLEALDLNTSAGFPYVTQGVKKRDLIPERGEPLTKLITALDLHGTNLPFVTYLKDELRGPSKIKAGKTRLIEASSLNDTIHMKRTYGRLFQVFHANPGTTTGCAVGCDPNRDWTRFAVELGTENLMAFDYTNFDASLSPVWFGGLKKVIASFGLDTSLIDHVCNSVHKFKNVEYDVEGGMPSGCSGTSIFNSIINNLIVRSLLLEVYQGIDLDLLKVIAYGDDLLVSYPFELDPRLIAEAGKKYGLTITPADKESEFRGMVPISEVTFLKRKFVFDEEFPFLCHPVFPWSEIYESIRWTRNAAHTQEHVRSLCELAWHAGRAEYESFIEKVRSVPVGRALALPSYDYLRLRWLDLF